MANNFIIIEPDPIVCMDVEGMLTDHFPDCRVVSGFSLSSVGAEIYNCGPDTALFVKSTLLVESDDLRRVAATAATRGSQIVVIGSVKDLSFPVTIVELPFTMDMVMAAIGRGPSGMAADCAP